MFSSIKKGLTKTLEAIRDVSPQKQEKISKELLEEILLECDVSYELVEEIIYYLPPQDKVAREDVKRVLSAYFVYDSKEDKTKERASPFVELIVGVNGAGKTTTIAKLAYMYKMQNKKVLLGAADTFRAAAVEQLKQWAKKIDVPIISTFQGHDPSAVVYDTISSGKARQFDNVIIDTAGRLHNQENLANELKKIVRICNKAYEGAPHRKYLILDGTQGNSATNQAIIFNKMIGIDALIITKLDGSAKGGALFSIAKSLELPIKYIGVGEEMGDLVAFEPALYIDSILDAIFES